MPQASLSRADIHIEGMDCASCAQTIETGLKNLPGVGPVTVSVARETAVVQYDAAKIDTGRLQKVLKSLGYPSTVKSDAAVPAEGSAAARASLTIGGMDCGSCALTVETALGRMPGLTGLKVSVSREMASFTLDESKTSEADLQSAIKRLGYAPGPLVRDNPVVLGDAAPTACKGHDHDHAHDHHHHDHGHDHGHCQGHDHTHGHHHHDHGHDHTHDHADGHAHDHAARPAGRRAWWRAPKVYHLCLSGLIIAAAFAVGLHDETIGHYAFIAATLFALGPIARRAYNAARFGAIFTIQMLMTIAAIGAIIIGEQEEAAIVVLLFMVGELLEGIAGERARSGIKALGKLLPQSATIEENGTERTVAVSALRIGQTVIVRPGDRVPADGEIVVGASSIDESPVTGESIPVPKAVGDPVLAGTINHDASLRVRVTKSAENNTIARIIALVEEAQDSKAPTERFIDAFSRIYMPLIIAISALVMVVPPLLGAGDFQTWIYRGLALLLIGCPCALVISVPAAIASSLASGARHGILIKGGAVMEALARIRFVVFDKTGTLTRGKPVVTDIVPFGRTGRDLLALAHAVERESSHPLAQAINAEAEKQSATGRRAENVAIVPGKGMEGRVDGARVFIGAPRFAWDHASPAEDVARAITAMEAQGKSIAVVVADGAIAGYVAMRDEPRAASKETIAALGKQRVQALMLTGDNRRTGEAIGRELNIPVDAEMLPEDKVRRVQEIARTTPVAMIGDGVNDAPALAQANVGVAMGGGTDVAMEAADAALMRDDIRDVYRMIGLSRASMRIIKQNVAIALGLKAVFLVTTVTGISGLWMAVLADTGATVLVTLNAMRLLMYFRGRA